MKSQSREKAVNECYQYIRDASSTENVRAIQDSESPVAIEQKMVFKSLAAQGWSKNEIVYEVQRIYGNDVLIEAGMLTDERSFLGKTIPIVLPAIFLASLLYSRKRS